MTRKVKIFIQINPSEVVWVKIASARFWYLRPYGDIPLDRPAANSKLVGRRLFHDYFPFQTFLFCFHGIDVYVCYMLSGLP